MSGSKEIKLSSGDVVIVDNVDYEWLSKFNWGLAKGSTGKKYCARRKLKHEDYDVYQIKIHRLILGLIGKQNRHIQIDHINGDGLDNRRCNLRACNASENLANMAGRSKHKFKGVSLDNKKRFSPWRARIRKDNQLIDLGYYPSAELAGAAYDGAAKALFGAFAKGNFI